MTDTTVKSAMSASATGAARSAARDPRPLLARAVATGDAVIAATRPDQLDGPTPCPDFTVRGITSHLVDVLRRVAALGRGEDAFGFQPSEMLVEGDRWLEAWRSADAEAAAAWADDSVLDRPMTLPWQSAPGRDILAGYLNELTVHTWDLARGTGQAVEWDDDVVAAALSAADGLLPAEGRMAIFEEVAARMGMAPGTMAPPFLDAVPVPDDAAPIDRLVAWSGRNPSA